MNTPLKAIRSVMLECNGLVTIGFKRTLIRDGITKPSANTGNSEAKAISNAWLTSPWTHIEAAMAYQIGLPILVFRERGVIEDGMLEKGVVGIYMPDFDVDNAKNYFTSIEWKDVIGRWEGYVRSVADKKGNPPQLY